MTTGIYKITNLKTNTVYIGASVQIETRFSQHLNELRKGTHRNTHLQNAFKKYGESNFEFTIVEECTRDILRSEEIRILNQYGGYKSNLTYNMRQGGQICMGEDNPNYGKHWSKEWCKNQSDKMKALLSDSHNHPMYGKHHSTESIEKNRQSHLGHKKSEDSKLKCSITMKSKNRTGSKNPFYGRHHTEEAKERIRIKSASRRHTPEEIEKIRLANTGFKHSKETIAKLKKLHQQYIWQYDDKEFGSSSDLCKYLNSHGYPKIVTGTITSLYNRGFEKSPTYFSLEGKIHRIPIDKTNVL